jgi:acetate kinase
MSDNCLNAGSSSIKFEAFEVIPRDELQLVFRGHFQGIGFRPHLTALISCDRVDLHQGASVRCNYRPN